MEANNPWTTRIDSFDPITRLAIFEKLGLKYIPFDYIQPPLEPRKEYVYNLLLLYLPTKYKHSISYETLNKFILSLYKGLKVENYTIDQNYINSMKSIKNTSKNTIFLSGLPKDENSLINFKNISICFQAIVPNHKNTKLDSEYICNFFHSYETDLLSSRFQINRPFITKFNYKLGKFPIKIHFPEFYTYLSEGNYNSLKSKRLCIDAYLHISETRLKSSEDTIFNIVISDYENDYFTEHEIIKLLNFIGSKQENINLIEQVHFSEKSDPDERKYLFFDFIKLLEPSIRSELKCNTGIIQFDTSTSRSKLFDSINFDQFYDALANTQSEKVKNFEKLYNNCSCYRNMSNVLCGIALGIFDFNRMGFDEVVDTLIPIKSNNSYLLFLNRGILMNICHDDEMFKSVKRSIGMSPYLIIPNMILANNEFQLEKCNLLLENILCAIRNNKKIQLDELRSVRRKADSLLNISTLPNIFQYKTEKLIYNYGISHRSIETLSIITERNIKDLEKIIIDQESIRSANSDLFMTILLSLVSCFQLQGIFVSFANNDLAMSWFYTLSFSFAVTCLIYFFNKIKSQN